MTDPNAEVAVGPVRVTIVVVDVNEAPTEPMEQRGGLSITGRDNVMFDEIMDDEASPDLMVGTYRGIGVDADQATWSLSGPDATDFSISSSGEVTFRTTPNFENPADADTNNDYQFTVEANDGTNDATLPVTITVVNVDEAGEVMLSTMRPSVGVEITASVTDIDGSVTDDSWKWASSDAIGGTYTNISGATNAAYTPVAADADMFLMAKVEYTDPQGANKSGMATATNAVVAEGTGDIVSQYDTDGTPGISGDEVINAVDDFFAVPPRLTGTQILDIVDFYFDQF